MELPVVNHPDYVAKINDDNKVPIKKFGALASHLLQAGVVKKLGPRKLQRVMGGRIYLPLSQGIFTKLSPP